MSRWQRPLAPPTRPTLRKSANKTEHVPDTVFLTTCPESPPRACWAGLQDWLGEFSARSKIFGQVRNMYRTMLLLPATTVNSRRPADAPPTPKLRLFPGSCFGTTCRELLEQHRKRKRELTHKSAGLASAIATPANRTPLHEVARERRSLRLSVLRLKRPLHSSKHRCQWLPTGCIPRPSQLDAPGHAIRQRPRIASRTQMWARSKRTTVRLSGQDATLSPSDQALHSNLRTGGSKAGENAPATRITTTRLWPTRSATSTSPRRPNGRRSREANKNTQLSQRHLWSLGADDLRRHARAIRELCSQYLFDFPEIGPVGGANVIRHLRCRCQSVGPTSSVHEVA